MSKAQTEEQLAVECGYWNNFRFNPEAEKKFTLDSKEPKGDYQEFLNGEVRYQTEEQLAVECGYWNNFRFNPEAEKKFTLDSKEPKGDYQEFLNGEVRYNALMRANPEKAQRLFAQNEAEAMERYEYLKGLVNLYDGTAKED